MESILTLLPGFGLTVSSGSRRGISGADGLLQKNKFFLGFACPAFGPGGERLQEGSSWFTAGDQMPSPAL
jgi:hypothetical protein